MSRILCPVGLACCLLAAAHSVQAAGSPYRLAGYATAGANPTVVFMVTDSQGNGVRGVAVDITVSAGTLDAYSGTTAADGTVAVKQSGGNLGDNITATCSLVSQGSPHVINASEAAALKNTDTVWAWYDESRRIFNAVAVTAGKGVLTASSNFNFGVTDNSSDYRSLTIGQRANIAQTADTPAQVEVYQGTFSAGDRIYTDETTVTGSINGDAYFSSSQPNRALLAYAVDGASPTVCAVVTDRNGVGVSGVSVSITVTAGIASPESAVTDVNGAACFYCQDVGAGNTLTVACPGLTETSPVLIVPESSQALETSDKLFAWFERKTRRVQIAVVNRETNVLVSAASSFTSSLININSNNIAPSLGSFTDQNSRRPASAGLAYGTSETGDLLRIYHNTLYRYPSYYHTTLEIPANESQYLLAFATGGMNPTVWAAVTDEAGNAVRGVTVDFAATGGASPGLASTATGWNGVTRTAVSGAGAYGTTITVSATGLGEIRIFTSPAEAVTATDRVYGWYAPETHKVFGAVVNYASNVLCADGTNLTDCGTLNNTTGNNSPTISSFSLQTQDSPCLGHIGFGTIEAGDYIRLNQTVSTADWDVVMIADPDPSKFLVAFANGGVDPTVWAVVMDDKGNGLEGEPVTFSSVNGAMSLTSTATDYGGFVTSEHSSGVLGNTITVSAPGLPPVDIITASAVDGTGDDWGFAWYDASRLTVWGIGVIQETNVIMLNSSYSNPTVYDNTDNNRTFCVNGPLGHNMSRLINPLNQWTIGFGTAGAGDEVAVNMGYTSPNPDTFIRLSQVKSSFLRAFAGAAVNPPVKALVLDADGIGLSGVSVTFNSSRGSMIGGPAWYTGFDGTVDSAQSGGALNDIITVSAAGYPSVQILVNNSGGVASSSQAVAWYSPYNRRLQTSMIQYPCYNVVVSGVTPDITCVPFDTTANNRTISVTEPKEDSQQLPTYAYVGQGTSGAGDRIRIQTTVTYATDDALIVLPAEADRCLHAFAPGGANPDVWAVVTDANGNGIPNVPVRFSSTGGSMGLTLTATDASGVTVSAQSGGALGNEIYIWADGVPNTVTVKTSAAGTVEPATRTLAWYDILNRTAHAAFVNVPNQVLSLSTSAGFIATDVTPNGRTFAVDTAVQQTGSAPSQVAVVNGTEGEGDQIWIGEDTATADPDAILTISVPTSEIVSSLSATPTAAVNGNTVAVTMTVFNNGTPAALTVTPSTLTVAGGASYYSGPSPTVWNIIPGGESRMFEWIYTVTAPGGVTFTGQAFGTDAFTMAGITSTATDSNPVSVRNPLPPVIVSDLSATPTAVFTYQSVTVTMTVSNISSTDVPNPLTVTPSALGISGPAAWVSGPTPPQWYIPRNESRDFTWIYSLDAPGNVTFTGQAYTVDPFDYAGVTSTATVSNVVNSRNPLQPYLSSVLAAAPALRSVGQNVTVTMIVANQSSTDVPDPLTVTPSALEISGPAAWVSGPTPPQWYVPRNESRDFTWVYSLDAPGNVTFTGQAYTVDPFDYAGVTSTATTSNTILVQSPALLACTLSGPANAERLRDFSLTMTVTNAGQASAVSVTPVDLTYSGVTVTAVSGPTPAMAVIPGGDSQDFIWTFHAGDALGTVQFSGRAAGFDANSNTPVSSSAAGTGPIQVIQGILSLEQILTSVTQAYQGQTGLPVSMRVTNTSLMPVTITASTLNFNGSLQGFIVHPAPDNPVLVGAQSTFTLGFTVDVLKTAPLGQTVIDGTITGDSGAGAMTSPFAQQTAVWEVLQPFNSLRQNYPNPLRLSRQAFTTFEYYVADDVVVTIKVYNLAGELVAILLDGKPGVGRHAVQWYGDNGEPGRQGQTVGSGVYLVVFKIGDHQEIKKAVVIR